MMNRARRDVKIYYVYYFINIRCVLPAPWSHPRNERGLASTDFHRSYAMLDRAEAARLTCFRSPHTIYSHPCDAHAPANVLRACGQKPRKRQAQ